jgi:hypothetical protein
MAAIISRSEILNDKLSATDDFEMDESFGIKTTKKTKDEDYEFPLQTRNITIVQDKDKLLIK